MLLSWFKRRSWTECVCVESSSALASSPPHPPALHHHFAPSSRSIITTISSSRHGVFINKRGSGVGGAVGSRAGLVEGQRLEYTGSLLSTPWEYYCVVVRTVCPHFTRTLDLWIRFEKLDLFLLVFKGACWDTTVQSSMFVLHQDQMGNSCWWFTVDLTSILFTRL